RFADAYVDGQWRFADIFFGILDRNWGPSGVQGVLWSDNPYSMDTTHLTFSSPGIQIQAMATQLDTRLDSAGTPVNRYMAQHRLWIPPRGRLTVSLAVARGAACVGGQVAP